jgi:hypothetical protein
LGLVVLGLYTIVDFNRLRRAGTDKAVPLAAGIFLDVLNIFLLGPGPAPSRRDARSVGVVARR